MKEMNDIYDQKDVDIVLVLKVVKELKITSDTFTFRDQSYPKKVYVV